MCTAFGSVACLVTWIILMSVIGALAPLIYDPPTPNGAEVRTDKPPFNFTLPTKKDLSPYCQLDDYYVYCSCTVLVPPNTNPQGLMWRSLPSLPSTLLRTRLTWRSFRCVETRPF
jgi:hypothetical protein